jgi:hypothetical protein
MQMVGSALFVPFWTRQTKFTTLPSSSKAQMNTICHYSSGVLYRERWGETDGREIQFRIYLILPLNSSAPPECYKTYFPMVHFIQIRTNKFIRLSERGRPGQVNGHSNSSRCTIRRGITGEIRRHNASFRNEDISNCFMNIISQEISVMICLFVYIFYTCSESHPREY